MRLQIEKAGDDLQVVLDSMVDLFQQHFLFAKRSTQGFVALADLVEHGVEAVHQQFEFIVSMRFGCWLFDCSVIEAKAVPKRSSPPQQRCKSIPTHANRAWLRRVICRVSYGRGIQTIYYDCPVCRNCGILEVVS